MTTIKIHFQRAAVNGPAAKLADAEIHFLAGPLAGLRLLGFAVWERLSPSGGRHVTFPARAYSVNGERRSFALLRPTDDPQGQGAFRAEILAAWEEFEAASCE